MQKNKITTDANELNFILAPDCVLIIAIQPFEILMQICACHDAIPSHRILAPGTMIDSAHFRLKE